MIKVSFCKKKQYSYFHYILDFQFALTNDQPNAFFSSIRINYYLVNFVQVKGCTAQQSYINPFQTNVSFLYPLKTSENRRFSDVFRGYRKGTLAWNRLRYLIRYTLKMLFCAISRGIKWYSRSIRYNSNQNLTSLISFLMVFGILSVPNIKAINLVKIWFR